LVCAVLRGDCRALRARPPLTAGSRSAEISVERTGEPTLEEPGLGELFTESPVWRSSTMAAAPERISIEFERERMALAPFVIVESGSLSRERGGLKVDCGRGTLRRGGVGSVRKGLSWPVEMEVDSSGDPKLFSKGFCSDSPP